MKLLPDITNKGKSFSKSVGLSSTDDVAKPFQINQALDFEQVLERPGTHLWRSHICTTTLVKQPLTMNMYSFMTFNHLHNQKWKTNICYGIWIGFIFLYAFHHRGNTKFTVCQYPKVGVKMICWPRHYKTKQPSLLQFLRAYGFVSTRSTSAVLSLWKGIVIFYNCTLIVGGHHQMLLSHCCGIKNHFRCSSAVIDVSQMLKSSCSMR